MTEEKNKASRARARSTLDNMESDFEIHRVGTAAKIADMQVRLLKAEGKLAELGRILDNEIYRTLPMNFRYVVKRIVDGQ